MGGAIGAVMLDMLRPSRRENTIGTLRPYQNPKSLVEKSYMFDPTEHLPTTNREITEKTKDVSFIKSNQNRGGYIIAPTDMCETNRESTCDHYYAGNASYSVGGTRSNEVEYNQRNNDIKSSTV